MPASRTIREQLTNFATFLLELDYAVTINPFGVSDSEVSWIRRPGADPFLASRHHHSLDNYTSWVRNGQFSVMLFDGALLQFSYEFDGDTIIGHRLAYVPCPFDDSENVLSQLDLDDFVEYYTLIGMGAVQFQSAIRFDYDPENAGESHPATHLTINHQDTRIACAGPVSPARFVRFVFRNFYPALTEPANYFDSLPKSGQFGSTITPRDADDMHVAWAS